MSLRISFPLESSFNHVCAERLLLACSSKEVSRNWSTSNSILHTTRPSSLMTYQTFAGDVLTTLTSHTSQPNGTSGSKPRLQSFPHTMLLIAYSRGPWLLVARDHGQTLRFYKATQARLDSTVMRNFLTEELWQFQEPWSSAFAPGGKRYVKFTYLCKIQSLMSGIREFVMHYFAQGMRQAYDVTVRIPKFVLMVITGALGSLFMRLLHRPEPTKPAAKPKPAVTPAPPVSTTPASSPVKKTGSTKKKTGKK